jgi:hypothetical protein
MIMIRRRSLFLVLPVVFLAASQPPRVTLSPASYDFGTVKQGETVRHAFAVKNSGDTPLRIERVELQLPGMKARFKPVVPPRGEGSIEIEWATERIAGTLDTEALVLVDDPAISPLRLALKLRATPPLEILPLPAVFLSAYAGEKVERVLTVESHEEAPITATVEGGGGLVDATLAPLAPGKRFSLTVRPAERVKPGRYEDTLTLRATGARPLTAHIPVHLFVKPDLYANPETVDFGRVGAAQKTDAPVETFLVKRRQGDFNVTSITCADPRVKIEITPKTPSETFRVDVRLVPSAPGSGKLETSIRIATDDPRFPALVVPVRAEVM